MNIFGWRKNLNISEQDPTHKVRYLGNVQTALMKGEGCVDKAAAVIWSNYMRSEHPGIEMKVVITGSGMKAYTKEQGLTEYRAHRISYCIAHPDYPKLFVWVYRHEGRKMKMELRCHAVLCKNEAKAKAMALQLHEKLSFALKEFQREKIRKQNSRLVLQRTNSLPKTGSILPLRTQLLSTANNFRPPVSKSHTAPKLGAITEDAEEPEEEFVEEEEEYEDEEAVNQHMVSTKTSVSDEEDDEEEYDENLPPTPVSAGPSPPRLLHKGKEHHDILEALNLQSGDEFLLAQPIIDLEVGNDLDELRRDDGVRCCLHERTDSDEESAESGFHDQDTGFPEQDPGFPEQDPGFPDHDDVRDGGEASGKGKGNMKAKRMGGKDERNGVDEEEFKDVCHYPSLDGEESDSSANSVSEKTSL
ncbi:protein FAM43A [Aplysia californica]|uniref:Protein FAM43A n=1 Tax=Aplysia californica TaxID=6500 RepID=A0ABM0JZQ3_APLCA|nr:protein FAM43A [Aplysia californica]XP_005105334.1 protein FAM43A [Aplysia californica]